MTTTAVIEHFDVFEQVRSGLTLRPVPRGRSSFVLQTVEELFVGASQQFPHAGPAAEPRQHIRHKVRRHARLDGPAHDFPIQQIQHQFSAG